MKNLIFTVTNDLSYDQRMIRICTSLSKAGYRVLLVGRHLHDSIPPGSRPYLQKRLRCVATKGKAFYFEFNLRLFLFLLFRRADAVCAIDLDTILPCYFISILKKTRRVYDAHELFCEMKEVVTRPAVYRIWKRVERFAVPKFPKGYTVNAPIAAEFNRMYGSRFEVIRNLPVLEPLLIPAKKEKFVLYQGAVNEGRCFETLIPAMLQVDAHLVICGKGNFYQQAQELVAELGLSGKVTFMGSIPPAQLKEITLQAGIGITLFENKGLSNYLSLGNRFFDYFHAGIPQVCVDYPAYREINNLYQMAVLIPDTEPATIAAAINRLLVDDGLYRSLQQNCLLARQALCWQNEEAILIGFYNKLFESVG